MENDKRKAHFGICIKNADNPASLELRKIYRLIPDEGAAENELVRVVDESGEDYLYPADFFVAIDLPPKVKEIFEQKNSYRHS